MIAYFDSSSLVKLLVPGEDGAELATTTLRNAEHIATSVVAYPECRAAIAAAGRASRLEPWKIEHAVEVLDQLWLTIVHVVVSNDLAHRAGELTARHRLRGFDAVHLASALTLHVDTTMVSWDRDLVRASQAEGLAILPPSV